MHGSAARPGRDAGRVERRCGNSVSDAETDASFPRQRLGGRSGDGDGELAKGLGGEIWGAGRKLLTHCAGEGIQHGTMHSRVSPCEQVGPRQVNSFVVSKPLHRIKGGDDVKCGMFSLSIVTWSRNGLGEKLEGQNEKLSWVDMLTSYEIDNQQKRPMQENGLSRNNCPKSQKEFQ